MKRKNFLIEALGLGNKTTITLTLCVLLFASGTSWFSHDSVFSLFAKGHEAYSLEKRSYRSATVVYSLLQNVMQVQSRLKGISVGSYWEPDLVFDKLQVILTQVLREEQVSFVVLIDGHNRILAGKGRVRRVLNIGKTPKAAYGLPGTEKAEKAIQALDMNPRLGAFNEPFADIKLQEVDAKVGCTLQDLPILRNNSMYGYELIFKQDAYCLGIQPQLFVKGGRKEPGLVLVAVEQTKNGKLVAGLLLNNFTELATYWQENYGTNKITIFVDKRPILTNMLKGDKSPDMDRVMDINAFEKVISGGAEVELSSVKANGLTYKEIYLPLFRDADKKYGYEVVGVLAVASGEGIQRDLDEVQSNLVINAMFKLLGIFIILIPINRLLSKQYNEIEEKQLNLVISNKNKESILTSINEGILGFDLEGEIVFSNESAKKLLREGFLESMNIGKFLQSDNKKRLLDSVFLNEFKAEQITILRADGTRFQSEYNTFRIYDDSGKLVFGFTFRDISEKLELEEERKNAAVRETKVEVRQELHDGLMHNIMGALTQIRLANMQFLNDVELAYSNLLEAERECTTALIEGRKLISLDKDKAPKNTKEVIDAVSESLNRCEWAGMSTHFEKSITINQVDYSIGVIVIRLAQEALGNVVLHSNAKNAFVYLLINEQCIHLVIEDDGVGTEKEQFESSEGFGIHSMLRRAKKVGGQFEIVTQKGGGMRISFKINVSSG